MSMTRTAVRAFASRIRPEPVATMRSRNPGDGSTGSSSKARAASVSSASRAAFLTSGLSTERSAVVTRSGLPWSRNSTQSGKLDSSVTADSRIAFVENPSDRPNRPARLLLSLRARWVFQIAPARNMPHRHETRSERTTGMEAPILGFNQSRGGLVDEVVRRVCAEVKDPQLVLNDAAYHEVRRLQSRRGPELTRWQVLARSLGRLSEAELRRELEELVRHYAGDVAGNFDPRLYKFATRALPGL